jgi:hypothetical protein
VNYTELTTAISDYTENTFTTTQLNLFITQAEQRIYNAVQFPALRKNVTGTLTIGNQYLQCPLDFLAVFSLAVIHPTTGAYTYLLSKDVSFMREAFPVPSATGQPKYYALFGPRSDLEKELTFILGPTPSLAYSAELHYFFYPESITTVAGGQTWLGDNFDSVLLYAALVEAYTFMKGETDMMQLYDGKFKEALLLAKRLGDGMENGDQYRDGVPKQKVT